jgi:hypothetical protein
LISDNNIELREGIALKATDDRDGIGGHPQPGFEAGINRGNHVSIKSNSRDKKESTP